MLITSLLSADRIFTDADISSKKKLLEFVAEQASEQLSLPKKIIFNKLLERERLGSTGLGHGFAVPHARLDIIDQAYAYFLKLKTPVNYDAMDQLPVDLIFVLFIPEASTDEHLQILAQLARTFSQPEVPTNIRNCHSADEILQLIASAEPQD